MDWPFNICIDKFIASLSMIKSLSFKRALLILTFRTVSYLSPQSFYSSAEMYADANIASF